MDGCGSRSTNKEDVFLHYTPIQDAFNNGFLQELGRIPDRHSFHQRNVDKVATSFFVTNIPDSLDAKGLWNACTPYGRLVDAFVANKRSKAGKRFGFIRYMGVTDPSSFVRSLSNSWVGNFHLYVSVARFQRPNPSKPNTNQFPRTSHPIPNPNFSKPNPNPNNSDQQSFASIVHGNPYPKPPNANNLQVTTCAVTLDDKDLIGVDDTSRVLLAKLKDLDSASNMYVICKNEGFIDFKIHHVGGSWIWIHFFVA
ncbi:RNA-directed DNA polymerase, eukaryota [Tanacetum coccineum]